MYKKLIAGALGLCLMVSFVMPVFADHAEETDPVLNKLREDLLIVPNFLQYTEYKMLRYKNHSKETYDLDDNSIQSSYYNDYEIKPTGASPLSLEFTGGRQKVGVYGEFGDTVNILTGAKAIDESLQLGSIGTDRGLVQQGAIISPETYDISEVEALKIESHPWEEMIGNEKVEVPEIFELVPNDYFVAYFRDMEKFTELENTIEDLSKPFERIMSLKNTAEVKDKVFKRLGISDVEILRKFIDEMALVSYDLDAYPNTDYALILKIKSDLLEEFAEDYVKTPKGQHGEVGDYYVIATDENTFELISDLKSDDAMSESLDFQYTLSVLESNFDGLVYFSESFVEKLTSPAYRINARRRNTILQALETLQYVVFAYRDITGKWPESVEQIVKEGYIAEDSVAEMKDYQVNEDGVVVHKVWNTIYDVTPLSRVEVNQVTDAEKQVYENFAEGYQSYWVEFIDPIGVAILVGDEIRFHTIILPLIEQSDYNWWKMITGEDAVSFDFIKNPAIAPSAQLISKFDLESALYAVYQEDPEEFGENDEYTSCLSNYSKYKTDEEGLRESASEACEKFEADKEEAVKLVAQTMEEAIGWEENRGILDFVGDEFTFAAGEGFEFKVNDFTKFDLFIGFELEDAGLAKDFVNHFFKWLIKEAFGSRGAGGGMLGLQVDEPIRNEYKGQEFYMIPTGFINVFYMFLDDRLYLAVSQLAINNLIDSSTNPLWEGHMGRLFDYVGTKQHAMAFVDFEKMEGWLSNFIVSEENFLGNTEFEQNLIYYTEALALADSLPEYKGDTGNVEKYYRFIPNEWFEAELYGKEGVPYVKVDGEEIDMREVQYGYFYGDSESEKKYKLTELIEKFDVDGVVEEWQEFKNFGVGMQFSEYGLDINLAFDNLESDKIDPRIAVGDYGEVASESGWGIWVLTGVLGLALIGTIVFFIKRKANDGDQILNQ